MMKMMFVIGKEINQEEKFSGRVLQARMTLEENIKKEKRDRMMEEVRKRMVLTPRRKRERQDDGEWMHYPIAEPALQPQAAEIRSQETEIKSQEDVTINIRKVQTPVTSFLVHQTPEDRRKPIGRQRNTFRNKINQMSSSFGSPQLKQRKGWKTGAWRKEEEAGSRKRMSGKMFDITSFFESKTRETENENERSHYDNNNPVFNQQCTMMCSDGEKTNQRGSEAGGGHFEATNISE